MHKAFGYGRISTEMETQIYSPESQEAIIKEFYERRLARTHTWGGFIFDPDTSGAIPILDRDGGRRLFAMVSRGDGIIFRDTSRAFRDSTDGNRTLDYCTRLGIDLYFLDHGADTTTASGRYIAEVLISSASFERRMIGQRTKWAMDVKRKANLPRNAIAPLGWKKVGRGKVSRFEKDEHIRVLGGVVAALRDGGMSYRQIESHLKANPVVDKSIGYSELRRLYLAHKLNYPMVGRDEIRRLAVAKGLSREQILTLAEYNPDEPIAGL